LIIYGLGDQAEMADYYFRTDTAHQVVAFTADEEYITQDILLGKPVVPLSELIAKLFNWWVFSAGLAVIAGAISWTYVLSRYQLSYAYNFISLLFPIMIVAGMVFFKEPFKLNLVIGSLLILGGIIIVTR
jgi:EamA-like transporter family.